MKAGIIGLPNVGKSTLFNALTASGAAEASNYPFCTIEPNIGVVTVPDPRLDTIHRFIESEKLVPTVLRLVDIAGLVRGASEGEGLGNQFLSHIREVDAILQVVRCFEDDDISHVDGGVDPLRDIETIETELLLADLQQVEAALDKASRTARSGDAEAKQRAALLGRCQEAISAGRPVRSLTVTAGEDKLLKGMGLLTGKPILFIANVGEDDLAGEGDAAARVRAHAGPRGDEVVAVCARLEAELAELEVDDRQELLESMGLSEPALHLVVRAAHKALGLHTFFTTGPKEIRADAIPVGATAPQAAGVIHTDFERGFIRVEVYRVDELEEYGGEAAIKAAGRLRVEGKDYVVRDGDVCHFLFNV